MTLRPIFLPFWVDPPGDVPAPPGEASLCNPRYLTQADLLALLERVQAPHYIDPIKAQGPGYEMYQAFAKVFERASLAVGRLECDVFILTAGGGETSTATVTFTRPNAAAGVVVLKAGTIVVTSKGGHQYVLPQDLTLTGTSAGPALVRAIAQGFEYDQPGPKTTATGAVLEGEIDTIELPLQDPAYGDPTVVVAQTTDGVGGMPAMLDALGEDRGIRRQDGEADGPYRERIRALPDTVSPDAIKRLVTRLLSPYTDAPYEFIETFDIKYQTCWDAPSTPIAANPDYDPNLFAYDDPRTDTDPSFRNRWLDEEEYRATFIVVVPNIRAVKDLGMAYDDAATDEAAHRTTNGLRAYNAFDVPALFAFGIQGAYDGYDVGKAAFYAGFWDFLQKAKAGGFVAIVELAGE